MKFNKNMTKRRYEFLSLAAVDDGRILRRYLFRKWIVKKIEFGSSVGIKLLEMDLIEPVKVNGAIVRTKEGHLIYRISNTGLEALGAQNRALYS